MNKVNKLSVIAFILLIHISFFSFSQSKEAWLWSNKIYKELSLSQRVGQLFMVATYSNRGVDHQKQIEDLIKKEDIGGLIFFQGDPISQVTHTNFYQSISKLPLLIGLDAEWGVGMRMRLDGGYSFPFAFVLGATPTGEHFSYKVGKKIGEHLKRMGVHINFAPVLDVNKEPKNPIISMRAFGSDPLEVAQRGLSYAMGLRENHIIAVAKHFPGHGNTKIDSHKSLPRIMGCKTYLEKNDLFPFKAYVGAKEQGMGIMVGHLLVQALEKEHKDVPTSLNGDIIEELLINQWDFKGLVFSDALNMNALKGLYPQEDGVIEWEAFKAGTDILLFPGDVQKAKKKIIESIEKGDISEERLKRSVLKILAAKYQAGLSEYKKIEEENLIADLNDIESKNLHEDILRKAITTYKSKDLKLPIENPSSLKIAYISMGGGAYEEFYNALKKENPLLELVEIDRLEEINKLRVYDAVIIGIHPKDYLSFNKTYKFSEFEKNLIKVIDLNYPLYLNLFTGPYSLMNLGRELKGSVVISYENTPEAQRITSDILFGKQSIYGKLPINIEALEIQEDELEKTSDL